MIEPEHVALAHHDAVACITRGPAQGHVSGGRRGSCSYKHIYIEPGDLMFCHDFNLRKNTKY